MSIGVGQPEPYKRPAGPATLIHSAELLSVSHAGPLPKLLGALPSLIYSAGNASKPFPAHLSAGTLPESLGALPSLAVLQSVCACVVCLTPLELLPSSTAGPLPESLGALPSLAVLQAGNNALSGTGSLVAFSQVWGHFLRMLVTCIAMDSTWQPGLLWQRSWALPPARRCLF